MISPRKEQNLFGLLLTRDHNTADEVRSAFALLEAHCEKAFIGCPADHSETLDGKFPLVIGETDVELLHNASQKNSTASWLVLTTDECHIDEARISFLIRYRSDDRPATVYARNDHSINAEYAIWEGSGLRFLSESAAKSEVNLLIALTAADEAHGLERLAPPLKTTPYKATTEITPQL